MNRNELITPNCCNNSANIFISRRANGTNGVSHKEWGGGGTFGKILGKLHFRSANTWNSSAGEKTGKNKKKVKKNVFHWDELPHQLTSGDVAAKRGKYEWAAWPVVKLPRGKSILTVERWENSDWTRLRGRRVRCHLFPDPVRIISLPRGRRRSISGQWLSLIHFPVLAPPPFPSKWKFLGRLRYRYVDYRHRVFVLFGQIHAEKLICLFI